MPISSLTSIIINIGNKHYKTPTEVNPYSLQQIIKKTYSK